MLQKFLPPTVETPKWRQRTPETEAAISFDNLINCRSLYLNIVSMGITRLPWRGQRPSEFFPKRLPPRAVRRYRCRQIPRRCWWKQHNPRRSSEIKYRYHRDCEYAKRQGRRLTMRLALQMWCFTTPPPTIIMPLFTAFIAILFNLLTSGRLKIQFVCIMWITACYIEKNPTTNNNQPATISSMSPGFLNEWKNIISPRLPSVNAGQNTGILFFAAQ